MHYWLMKSEPSECSINDLAAKPELTVAWTGVRNYQARNFMRDRMRPGELFLFWHSSCLQPGIVGIASIASLAYPDPSQFDPASPYHDPKSAPDNPRWLCVDVRFGCRVALLAPSVLRGVPELAGMQALRPGNRLSITPVTQQEWVFITTYLARLPGGGVVPFDNKGVPVCA